MEQIPAEFQAGKSLWNYLDWFSGKERPLKEPVQADAARNQGDYDHHGNR
jgi:hypothetical protein